MEETNITTLIFRSFYSTLKTGLETTSQIIFNLHLITEDCDTEIQNTQLSLLSNFTHPNHVVNKYNPGWIYH